MKLTTLPLSSPASPASPDAPANAATADAAKGFAGMMAGAGHQPVSKPAPKATKDTDAAPDDDDKSNRTKDREDAASLLALSVQAAPLMATPLPVATNVQADDSAKTNATVTATTGDPAAAGILLSATTTDPQAAIVQTSTSASATATLQALAAATAAEPPAAQATAVQAAGPTIPNLKPSATAGSTASFLLARSTTKVNTADRTKDDTDADDIEPGDATATATVVPLPVAQTVTTAITASSGHTADAGQSLATLGADRQLDLAKDSAWLDGLARDIASTGDNGGTLRFQLSPQQLGNLSVEVKRGDDGAVVTLTTSSSAAQAILSDAKPQLIAEARAHGLQVSDARIDFSGSNTSGQGSDAGARQREAADTTPRDAGTANGGGSDAGRQAQQQARAEPDIIPQSLRVAVSSTVDSVADTSSAVVNASETDALYA